jgi:hypothetical protein
MHLEPGQDSEVIIDDEDTTLLRRVSRPPNHGLIDLLQACPYPFELPPRTKDQGHAAFHRVINYLVDTNVSSLDSQLAATAQRNGLTMVTRNTADFKNAGVKLLNPFSP